MNLCLSLITAKAEEERASLRSWIVALQKQNKETFEEAKINVRLRGKKQSNENDRCRKGWAINELARSTETSVLSHRGESLHRRTLLISDLFSFSVGGKGNNSEPSPYCWDPWLTRAGPSRNRLVNNIRKEDSRNRNGP